MGAYPEAVGTAIGARHLAKSGLRVLNGLIDHHHAMPRRCQTHRANGDGEQKTGNGAKQLAHRRDFRPGERYGKRGTVSLIHKCVSTLSLRRLLLAFKREGMRPICYARIRSTLIDSLRHRVDQGASRRALRVEFGRLGFDRKSALKCDHQRSAVRSKGQDARYPQALLRLQHDIVVQRRGLRRCRQRDERDEH